MKKLIINADDFGLHVEINKAIMDAATNGVLTSTTVVANGRAFDDAVTRLESSVCKPAVGAHLTLVAEQPVADEGSVLSLLTKEGQMHGNYLLFLKLFLQGRIKKHEIYTELDAQVKKIKKSGLSITHFDSHQHLHVFPGIREIVWELAKTHEVNALRYPGEAWFFSGGYTCSVGRYVGKTGLTMLSKRWKGESRKRRIVCPERFYGMLAGGHMNELLLKNIIEKIDSGISEIMVHPGSNNRLLEEVYDWKFAWEDELHALKSEAVKELIREKNIELVSYSSL